MTLPIDKRSLAASRDFFRQRVLALLFFSLYAFLKDFFGGALHTSFLIKRNIVSDGRDFDKLKSGRKSEIGPMVFELLKI